MILQLPSRGVESQSEFLQRGGFQRLIGITPIRDISRQLNSSRRVLIGVQSVSLTMHDNNRVRIEVWESNRMRFHEGNAATEFTAGLRDDFRFLSYREHPR